MNLPHLRPTRMSAQERKNAINAALDLLHRRWVLRILWELRGGALNFRELQAACGGLSMSVLSRRLAELREAELLVHEPAQGYALNAQGQELMVAARPLISWSARWAQRSKAQG